MSSNESTKNLCLRHRLLVSSGMVQIESVEGVPEGKCPLCAASESVKLFLPEGLRADERMFEGVLYAALGRLTGSPLMNRMAQQTMAEAVHAEVTRQLDKPMATGTRPESRGVVTIEPESSTVLDDEFRSEIDVEHDPEVSDDRAE